ncbi:MAG TPA: hypothetical protein VKT71_05945 [Candidatus Acidoferrales bacterium]|nr:hypothetical protein [Candidatus Acidoferrales bacterium]
MTATIRMPRGFIKPLLIFFVSAAALAVCIMFFGATMRRAIREYLMQSVTSAHYEILCPPGALSQDAMEQFAKDRETLFTALDKKLGDAGSNSELRIVLDPNFPAPISDETGQLPYSVSGTTIRTKLLHRNPQLPSAADAQALLYVAWGKPGHAEIARWTAIWLLGEWRGSEIGMAAAHVEQRLGHQQLEALLANPANEIASPNDQSLLGAAWISEIAEFGGMPAVRKLYAAKMSRPSIGVAAAALGTTPLELDRKWQMWMYAYLAGMPAMPSDGAMPMNMPMGR